MSNSDWVPTARLRFVLRQRAEPDATMIMATILQQWFAPDVPGYMRRDAEGEWRDVIVEQETAP